MTLQRGATLREGSKALSWAAQIGFTCAATSAERDGSAANLEVISYNKQLSGLNNTSTDH